MPMSTNSDDLPGVCAGCGGRIVDRYYLLAVDKQWHVSCLKCSDCKYRLDSELTCFARDGLIYCKEDYYRYEKFFNFCIYCILLINSNYGSFLNVYHLYVNLPVYLFIYLFIISNA